MLVPNSSKWIQRQMHDFRHLHCGHWSRVTLFPERHSAAVVCEENVAYADIPVQEPGLSQNFIVG